MEKENCTEEEWKARYSSRLQSLLGLDKDLADGSARIAFGAVRDIDIDSPEDFASDEANEWALNC